MAGDEMNRVTCAKCSLVLEFEENAQAIQCPSCKLIMKLISSNGDSDTEVEEDSISITDYDPEDPYLDDTPEPEALNQRLRVAAREGDLNSCVQLIKAGADVNSRGPRGWTPLHVAANNDEGNACALLLSASAEVDALTDSRRTPLHLAVTAGLSSSWVLLCWGSDPCIADEDGIRVIHRAMVHPFKEMYEKYGQVFIQQVKKALPMSTQQRASIAPLVVDYLAPPLLVSLVPDEQ